MFVHCTTRVVILVHSMQVYTLYISTLHKSMFYTSKFALVYSTWVHLACNFQLHEYVYVTHMQLISE